jgi:GNAT superfamily N-acetyltransferase
MDDRDNKNMIRRCHESDFEVMYSIINDAAQAYCDVIPKDCWKVPYMPQDELRHEIEGGIAFWGYEEDGRLIGVMGIQHVQDVTVIRHAYTLATRQRQGIGSKLLSFLYTQTSRPTLIGTWADAFWAVRFYEKHGFSLVTPQEKDRLLKKYWSITARQIETSVVLADQRWNTISAKPKE